jgi:hypothetical protein
VRGPRDPHPHLPDRGGRGQRVLVERPVQPEVHVHRGVRAVHVEQVLAVRLGALEHPAVHKGRRGLEPALRTGHLHRRTHEEAPVELREPVQRVAFGHGYGSGGATWVVS